MEPQDNTDPCPKEREKQMIAHARQEDRQAFDELYALHEKGINGFIRVRARDDSDARQVAQETRLIVWEKMPTYNPARAPFPAFAKYWAGFMLLRYYSRKKDARRQEALFSELQHRFRDLEQEPEIEGLLARLSSDAGRSISAEEELLRAEEHEERLQTYEKLLRLTFGSCSPPHQLNAFGFVRLLGMKPQQVAAELSEPPLKELTERLEKEYVEQSQLPESRVLPHFRPLHEKLEKPFSKVVTEPKTLKTYPQERFPRLYNCPSGATALQDYYTSDPEDPEKNISHWCDAVRKRTRKKWLEQHETSRCE